MCFERFLIKDHILQRCLPHNDDFLSMILMKLHQSVSQFGTQRLARPLLLHVRNAHSLHIYKLISILSVWKEKNQREGIIYRKTSSMAVKWKYR